MYIIVYSLANVRDQQKKLTERKKSHVAFFRNKPFECDSNFQTVLIKSYIRHFAILHSFSVRSLAVAAILFFIGSIQYGFNAIRTISTEARIFFPFLTHSW